MKTGFSIGSALQRNQGQSTWFLCFYASKVTTLSLLSNLPFSQPLDSFGDTKKNVTLHSKDQRPCY